MNIKQCNNSKANFTTRLNKKKAFFLRKPSTPVLNENKKYLLIIPVYRGNLEFGNRINLFSNYQLYNNSVILSD